MNYEDVKSLYCLLDEFDFKDSAKDFSLICSNSYFGDLSSFDLIELLAKSILELLLLE